MASKLVNFQPEIFSMIENDGFSYSQVLAYLKASGLIISKQALHSWYKRTRVRISNRKKHLNTVVCDQSGKDQATSMSRPRDNIVEAKQCPDPSIAQALNNYSQTTNARRFNFPDVDFLEQRKNMKK